MKVNENKQKYPFYIVSRSRTDSRLTDKALTKLGIDFYTVVEEDEEDIYKQVVDKPENVLVVPKKYHDEYNNCDDLGQTKSQGPGVARNFCWDHSVKQGYERHWVFDDNIRCFYRLHNNLKVYVKDGVIFKAMADFVDRYTNIAIAGPNYNMFAPQRQKNPPFVLNTRIYSMLLINNDIPYRWRGRYNEDTDLSLRVLKDGWVTVQFNAFLGDKPATQRMRGGNSKEFYDKEGTYQKSKMQVDLHPDVSRLTWKFNRIHHYVDYSSFKNNRLIRKEGIIIPEGTNNYGMKLKKYKKEEKR